MTRVRISDVASAAGVSAATVSLVLNDAPARISDETRDRVRRVAAEIGYAPNSIARSLRTNRTRTIGIVSDEIATTPFAGRMLAGAQEAAAAHGYLVFLVDTGADAELERRAIGALSDQRVDGMIYARMWHQIVEAPAGLPEGAVFMDCSPRDGGFPAVVPDDEEGGRAAVREVLAAGHTRIAYLNVPVENAPIASGIRHRAYEDELLRAGIEIDPELHVRGESSARGGRLATERLFALGERRPTAVVAFNDRMAAGAYTAAHRAGLRIPDDLSIVGYDDQLLIAAELDPPLSTVALPHAEMGRWAMEVAIGARSAGTDQPHRMPCPIIRRSSVAPPRPAGTADRTVSDRSQSGAQ